MFLTNVSQEQLLNQPGLQPLRRKLLGSALDYYQDFVQQGGDDPNLRRQLADAYSRVGEINGELGSHAEAIAALHHSLEILEPLRKEAPTDVTLAIAAARASQALGYSCLRNDEAESGERAIRSAIATLEPLERDHPEVAEYGRRLGRCYDLLGVVGIVSSRYAQYLPSWDQAVVVLERTIARHQQDLEARSFLVKAFYNRGSAQEGFDNFEAAAQSGRQAVELGRQFQKLFPDDPVIMYDIGMSLEFLGDCTNSTSASISRRSGTPRRPSSCSAPCMRQVQAWPTTGVCSSRVSLVRLRLGLSSATT